VEPTGEYPGLGFATYRITVKLPVQSNVLAIYFPGINSAAKVWINGEKIMEVVGLPWIGSSIDQN